MLSKNMTLWAFLAFVLLAAACGDTPTKYVCDEGYSIDGDAGVCVRLPDTCEPGVPNSIRTECGDQHRSCVMSQTQAACGACLPGFKDVAGKCKALVECKDLACDSEHRDCVEADQVSQAVCGNCQVGYIEDGVDCVSAGCEPEGGYEGLASICAAENRLCVDKADGAECSGCWDGYVADGDGCRPAVECSLLGCVDAGKECIPAEGNKDARCGDCLPGRDPDAACAPREDTDCSSNGASSLAAVCAKAHRSCLAKSGQAECGPCDKGYVLDSETGLCLKVLACKDLNCGKTHQGCAVEPTAHCEGCEESYVADVETGECRPVLTCADLDCGKGIECAEQTTASDAYCRPRCEGNTIWNGLRCQSCPKCDGPGEDGVWGKTSVSGQCLCRTKPGYFVSAGAEVGTYSCDDDADGWVRESARNAINSKDPALASNARCALQIIDRVELVNENVVGSVIELDQPVALYETDRTDSDSLWQATSKARGNPRYGVGVQARDLNRMTKVCHFSTGDYNDNGVPDVEEHAGLEPSPSLLPEHRTFNKFSYFMELHWGRYEGPETFRTFGRYVVREKTRRTEGSEFAQFRVPMKYGATDGGHWRECRVARDSAWEGSPAVGFDFAQFDASPTWAGMNHHSQFKCFVVNDSATAQDAGQIRRGDLVADYRINRCQATQRSTAFGSGGPALGCDLVAGSDVRGGNVVWGAALYTDHRRMGTAGEILYPWNEGTATYTRGCVNDCVDEIVQCTEGRTDPGALSCIYDATNFGLLLDCRAEEICDGQDNDLDGDADEGNPGGGAPCDTNQLGECADGLLLCKDAHIICDPIYKVTPATVEICNALDDTCDGLVDENVGAGPNPTPCEVQRDPQDPTKGLRDGICRLGALQCKDGSYSDCQPTVWDDGTYADKPFGPALVEIGCNDIDDDCDGHIDECPLTSGVLGDQCEGYKPAFGAQCDPGWNKYRQDADGDQYPAATLTGVTESCGCSAPSGGILATAGRSDADCCDTCSRVSTHTANETHPGETPFYTGTSCCPDSFTQSLYDFNCDHKEESHLTTRVSNPCQPRWSGGRYVCQSTSTGWLQDTVPACGEAGKWHNGTCSTSYFLGFIWLGCTPLTYTRAQECR